MTMDNLMVNDTFARIGSMSSAEDKAALFRVLSVHALAGIEIKDSFLAICAALRQNADDGSREMRLAAICEGAAAIYDDMRAKEGVTVAQFFEAAHVNLTIWEGVMLAIPMTVLDSALSRQAVFAMLVETVKV